MTDRYRSLFDASPYPQILTRARDVLDSNVAARALGADFLSAFRAGLASAKLAPGTDLRTALEDGAVVMTSYAVDAHRELLWIGRRTSFSDHLLRALSHDRRRVEQIVTNLLSNALAFTDPGGRVDVAVDIAGSRDAMLSVRNDGRGIAPAFLPHVFDGFRQDRSDPRGAASGLGVGLFLVRRLVEQHGGSVVAASDGPGKGATFTVTLPLARGAARDAARAPSAFPDDDTLAALRLS